MKYLINGREIKFVCSYHGVKYGKQKQPKNILYLDGLCDICEEINENNIPKSVTSLDTYQGIMVNDTDGLIVASE